MGNIKIEADVEKKAPVVKEEKSDREMVQPGSPT